ncbi:PDC sensor domain-containing protein [Tautonia sociabilis]|uniref:Cache domain-containing protein n=1 Tax=Tautonia sociabilis TaxID=2080755 RepID=A0A432MJK2_9BACT|nr:hypothetical protein [Tautonia sociabilis]RUL87583.1 hypothetical protein TsocGM_11275 [Tautonia sociabilis]
MLAGFVALSVVALVSMGAAAFSQLAARSEQLATEQARIAFAEADRLRRLEAEARARAEASHARVVRGAASFAAETIAREVSAIGRVLQAEAASPLASETLAAAVASPDDPRARKALQDWLESVSRLHEATVISSNWFVTGPDGTQLARAPFGGSVGQNFAYRDYFHGLGRDLDPAEAARLEQEGRLEMVRGLHQTLVYRSVATGNPMTTFSIPISDPTDPDGSALGVLGLSVEIGDFDVLRTGADSDLVAMLVDTRVDATGTAGLILQHPALSALGPDPLRRYLSPELVSRLVRLRSEVMLPLPGRDGQNPGLAIDPNFADPFVGPPDGLGLAAFHPVIARGPDGLRDTGWVVIVQGRRLRPAEE